MEICPNCGRSSVVCKDGLAQCVCCGVRGTYETVKIPNNYEKSFLADKNIPYDMRINFAKSHFIDSRFVV